MWAVVLVGCGRIGFDPPELPPVPDDGQLLPWESVTSLPQGREQLGLVVHDGVLYATGGDDGVNDNGTGSIMYAPINSDGSLGAWTIDPDSQIPDCRYRHTSVVASQQLFVIGGSCGGNPQADAFRALVLADKSVGGFGASLAMPVGRRRHTTWLVNNYVFVVGGSNPGFNTVYSARVEDDGSILAWNLDPNLLPGNRYWHASALANGYAYVIGGNDEVFAWMDTVFYARVNDDGTTGAWQTNLHPLPTTLTMAVAFAANGYLYVAGGRLPDGTTTSATIYGAKLLPDGSTEAWKTIDESLPEPRSFHALAMTATHVYIAGGDADSTFGGAVDTVYALRIR